MRLDPFEYETTPDGSGDGGPTGDTGDTDLDTAAAGLDADAAADTDTGDAPAAGAEGPDYAAIFGRPEFQEALGGAVHEALLGLIPAGEGDQTGFATPPEQPIDFSELDPITDPEGYAQAILRANIQAFTEILDQRLGPFQPALERTAQAGWVQETDDYYTGIEKEVGGFDHNVARALAAGLDTLTGGRERDPHGTAARQLAAYVKQEREAAVEEYKKSLPGMRDDSTPYEPGIGGSGVAGDGKPRDEREAALAFVGRRQGSQV